MSSFASDRKWALEKKNDVAAKSIEIEKKTDDFSEKRNEFEEGISRIPTDLPEEIQQQIDTAIQNAKQEIEREGKEIEQEADDIQHEAEETMQAIGNTIDEYTNKAEKMRKVGVLPLIGNFAEMKANEISEQAEQMKDIYLETQEYTDKLAESRRIIINK